VDEGKSLLFGQKGAKRQIKKECQVKKSLLIAYICFIMSKRNEEIQSQ